MKYHTEVFCINCGKYLRRKQVKFCCDRCRRVVVKETPLPKRECPVCNRLYEPSDPTVKTCSLSCGSVIGGMNKKLAKANKPYYI